MPEHFDIIIIGAGLSGIGAACRLTQKCPSARFIILEARGVVGGTWDLFRYPGVRSDSDMLTLGYPFRPWRGAKSLAPAGEILTYIRETAAEFGVDKNIRFGHRLIAAAWSTAGARWTLEVERAGAIEKLSTRFLFMCGGYYNYKTGHMPEFPGAADFRGRIVHPQFWPAGMDVTGKRVVVIGSGATAVTLVPALAESAAQVVMLQRSPTYIFSRPAVDPFAARLRKFLPSGLAARLVRWKNILETQFTYRLARKNPAWVKRRLIALIRAELGQDFDVDRHFTPAYNPWDQRLCLVPDGDLFKAIKTGRAAVETGEIERFTTHGVRLRGGRELAADVIITATGLQLQLMGGAALTVDGKQVESGQTLCYKGMMLAGVPNFAFVVGYTNASWTLKADLVSVFVCRLLNFMRRRGFVIAVPERATQLEEVPIIDFSSGYIQRALHLLPKQGTRAPWLLRQNYLRDMPMLRWGRLRDGVLQFRAAWR